MHMSKAEILDQLPKLNTDERFEIFSFLWELEEKDFFSTQQPSEEEKYLLDQAEADYQANPNSGSSWEDVKARILSQL
ncbi:MAG: hypothetical protein K2W97_05095 [Chthoniobacterales bacterium]|nr:hypothetical protein [Chthoniobacterales bacterium]